MMHLEYKKLRFAYKKFALWAGKKFSLGREQIPVGTYHF